MNDLASELLNIGRYGDALKMWEEVLPLYKKVYGEEHDEQEDENT